MQDNEMKCKKTTEKGPILLIDLQDYTLYLQMDTSAETTSWEAAIKTAALQNGPELSQQQLTKDDVPTIVDKTINFINTHGLLEFFWFWLLFELFQGALRKGFTGEVGAVLLLGSFYRRLERMRGLCSYLVLNTRNSMCLAFLSDFLGISPNHYSRRNFIQSLRVLLVSFVF